MRSSFWALCVALGLLLLPGHALADPARDQFELANSRYKNGSYEEAAGLLRALLGVKIDPEKDKERAAVYLQARPVLVACLFAMRGLTSEDQAAQLVLEADSVILDQYKQDPWFKLPGGYPQEVSDRWIEVSKQNEALLTQLRSERVAEQRKAAELAERQAKREAERIEKLEEMAAEERFVDTRSRVVAMVPFGVGQFQNDDIGLGIFFAASETLIIATAIVSLVIAQDIKDTKCPDSQLGDDGNLFTVDCDALMSNFEAARAVNFTALAVAGGLMISGIIQAQVAFEPERVTTRKRPIPAPVRLSPVAVITPDYGLFGLAGAF